jgi:hypothetical protein
MKNINIVRWISKIKFQNTGEHPTLLSSTPTSPEKNHRKKNAAESFSPVNSSLLAPLLFGFSLPLFLRDEQFGHLEIMKEKLSI